MLPVTWLFPWEFPSVKADTEETKGYVIAERELLCPPPQDWLFSLLSTFPQELYTAGPFRSLRLGCSPLRMHFPHLSRDLCNIFSTVFFFCGHFSLQPNCKLCEGRDSVLRAGTCTEQFSQMLLSRYRTLTLKETHPCQKAGDKNGRMEIARLLHSLTFTCVCWTS